MAWPLRTVFIEVCKYYKKLLSLLTARNIFRDILYRFQTTYVIISKMQVLLLRLDLYKLADTQKGAKIFLPASSLQNA
jgi:hypothetical protein